MIFFFKLINFLFNNKNSLEIPFAMDEIPKASSESLTEIFTVYILNNQTDISLPVTQIQRHLVRTSNCRQTFFGTILNITFEC